MRRAAKPAGAAAPGIPPLDSERFIRGLYGGLPAVVVEEELRRMDDTIELANAELASLHTRRVEAHVAAAGMGINIEAPTAAQTTTVAYTTYKLISAQHEELTVQLRDRVYARDYLRSLLNVPATRTMMFKEPPAVTMAAAVSAGVGHPTNEVVALRKMIGWYRFKTAKGPSSVASSVSGAGAGGRPPRSPSTASAAEGLSLLRQALSAAFTDREAGEGDVDMARTSPGGGLAVATAATAVARRDSGSSAGSKRRRPSGKRATGSTPTADGSRIHEFDDGSVGGVEDDEL